MKNGILNPGVQKREVWAWAMYDFANSGYTTVVLTAVYSAYFVKTITAGADWGTLAWTVALSVSYALALITSPRIGAYADRHANKKRLLAVSTLMCVVCTCLLAWPGPGQVLAATVLLVLSNLFYSYGETLCAAFLPELAQPHALGRVSGWGWAWGYCGGMLALGLCLAYVLHAQAADQPATVFVPITMLITAVLYGAASLPTFALLRERSHASAAQTSSPAASATLMQRFAQWRAASQEVARQYPDFARLMYCCFAYQAGVAVAITIAAIYAEQVLGFAQTETITLIFALNIAAAIGAFGFGYVQDKLGQKPALAATLWMWVATCIIAAASTSKSVFWIAATMAGLSMGSSQSAGRALAGLLAPGARRAEFYGLWGVATRLASITGPLCYGILTWASGGQHRLAIAATGVFFLVALWVLRSLDLQRGQALVQN